MSRAATGDTVVLRPVNNIYTVLSGVALVVGVTLICWKYFSAFVGLSSPCGAKKTYKDRTYTSAIVACGSMILYLLL